MTEKSTLKILVSWLIIGQADMRSSHFLLLSYLLFLPCAVFAARIELPFSYDDTRQTISVVVTLDTEEEKVNAYSGHIQYDDSKLSLQKIETDNSIVTSWITYPEKDDVTVGDGDIPFEGISQGGFSGIVMPDSIQKKPGKLFTLVFFVRDVGNAVVKLSDVHVYKDDGSATELIVPDKSIVVLAKPSYKKNDYEIIVPRVEKTQNDATGDLYVSLETTSELYDGSPFVLFENMNKQKSIENFDVAESAFLDPKNIPYYSWTKAKSPYLLTGIAGAKYVYVRAHYSDDTYSVVRVKSVEKKDQNFSLSYILEVVISLLGALLLYVFFFLKKKI